MLRVLPIEITIGGFTSLQGYDGEELTSFCGLNLKYWDHWNRARKFHVRHPAHGSCHVEGFQRTQAFSASLGFGSLYYKTEDVLYQRHYCNVLPHGLFLASQTRA